MIKLPDKDRTLLKRLTIGKPHKHGSGSDPLLDRLMIPNEIRENIRALASYEIGPDDLSRLFERSMADLDGMRIAVERHSFLSKPKQQRRSARKDSGSFYTPPFLAQHTVEAALKPVLKSRFRVLQTRLQRGTEGKQKEILEDPAAFGDSLTPASKAVLVQFWEEWLLELKTIRIVDPACGTGVFLLVAFEQMEAEYARAVGFLTRLRGRRDLDITRTILEHNLYGVDLNAGAVEIARLSLRMKAKVGGRVASLHRTIRRGNSVVSDKRVHPLAFDWIDAFPEAFAAEGFDAVVGNPPFVRHEWIGDFKRHFRERFPKVYSSAADLYVYFFALGHEILKPGCRLGFVSSSTFTRAAFAEPLRRFLTTECRLEAFIDLGDTQIFTDAKDVCPAIVAFSKRSNSPSPSIVRTLKFRRGDRFERLGTSGVGISSATLDPAGWRIESAAVLALSAKLLKSGRSLGSYTGGAIYSGVQTGANSVFVISEEKRAELVAADPRSAEIIKPLLQGKHLRPWHIEDSEDYLIFARRGIDIGEYPAVEEYLQSHRESLELRPDDWSGKGWKGRSSGYGKWFELQNAVDYWKSFEGPKIVWADIGKSAGFSLDKGKRYLVNTAYTIPGADYFLLGVLNSRAIWFAITNLSTPFGERIGEFRYRLIARYMQKLPIPDASPSERSAIAHLAEMCCGLGHVRYRLEESFRCELTTAFRTDLGGKLNEKAIRWWEPEFIGLGEAVRASFRLKLNPFTVPKTAEKWEPYWKEKGAGVKTLRLKLAEAEAEIDERVCRLFQFTKDEVKLLKSEVNR